MLKFSQKELDFIKSFASGENATQAAIIAGYPKASARVAGSRFLAKTAISEAIEIYKKDPSNAIFKEPAKKIKATEPKKKERAITEVIELPAVQPFFDESQIPQAKPQNGDFKITHDTSTPLGFLLSVMQSEELDVRQRTDAAKAALQYMHPKIGDVGKKEAKVSAAKAAGKGRFAATAAPARVH